MVQASNAQNNKVVRVSVGNAGNNPISLNMGSATEYYSGIAKQWATKTDGMVLNEGYSAKYWAQQTQGYAQDVKTEHDNAITDITNTKDNALTDITSAQTTAETSIKDLQTETETAVNDGLTTITNAKTEITATKDTAISDIQAQEKTSTTAVTSAQETATADITEKHTAAVEEIETKESTAVNNIETTRAKAMTDIDTKMTADFATAKRYVEESGGKGMPTDICKNLNIDYDTTNRKVKLKWKDPNDTYNTLGQVMASWKGTIITAKEGSYPDNYDDGTIILNNLERNKYNNQDFIYSVPESITDIKNLKFRAFPYSVNDVYNKDNRNCFDKTVIYEFLYDSTNSNTQTCITRPQGCLNEFFKNAHMDYTKGVFDWGDWEDVFFNNIQKPCMVYNDKEVGSDGNSKLGQIMEYLNPDDYNYTIDGEKSNVANTACNANAMVQWYIRDLWIKIVEYLPKKFHIYVSNKQVDNEYKNWLRFNKDGEEVDYYYNAMYDGCSVNNVIRSLSGQAINNNTAGQTQIAYARANGKGWDTTELRFVFVRNILLMMISGTTDTQTAFGTGRYSGGSDKSYNQLNTGMLNTKGAFYGDNNNGAVKVWHSENPWGNVWKIMQGLLQTGNAFYIKLTPNTNDGSTVADYQQTSVEGYIPTSITLSGSSGGYISGVGLAAGSGFLPSVVSGSSSTFIPDGCWWNGSIVGFARVGSVPTGGLFVGAFALAVGSAVSGSTWLYGVALSYTPS